MNIEALNKAIEVLQMVQDNEDLRTRFDLKDWLWYDNYGDKERILNAADSFDVIAHTCGTTACAVGYCALHPWFKERGLTLADGGMPLYMDENGEEHSHWHAIWKMFGIDHSEAQYLFSGACYPRLSTGGYKAEPRHVIERIKQVLDGGVSAAEVRELQKLYCYED